MRPALPFAGFGLLTACAFFACSSTTERSGYDDPSNKPAPSLGGDDASSSFGWNDGGSTSQDDDCPDNTKQVYVVDMDRTLRQFDPPTSKFTTIGTLDCSNSATTFSMAVDRSGTAWVLYDSGEIFKVSTKDASCTKTAFEPRQDKYSTFGMGFATDSEGGSTETLYVSSSQDGTLAKIDTTTMELTELTPIAVKTRVELTGTGSGQLFGLLESKFDENTFDFSPWTVAELDKSTGASLFTKPEPGIPEGSSNFAFAAWGGDFYSFVGHSVFHYDTKGNNVTEATTTDFQIVGAGVSTCAPHAIVK
jgi:hypothetical protein